MTLQDTDLLLVNKNGINYKISALDLKLDTKDYDYLLVSRDGTNYKLQKIDFGKVSFDSNVITFDSTILTFDSENSNTLISSETNLLPSDYLFVSRSSTNYKITGSSFISYFQ